MGVHPYLLQHHRGRPPHQEVWVFGLVDTSHVPALGYKQLVARDSATLLPIIQQHTAPGTTIWSDQWRAYNALAALPGIGGHSSVNHSLNFVEHFQAYIDMMHVHS